jgi:hypothetical protein
MPIFSCCGRAPGFLPPPASRKMNYKLESIGCRLRVAGLYENVEFDPAQNV